MITTSTRGLGATQGEATLDVDARFERAYRDEWSAVFRFAVAWTNDLHAAEDIAQEAFARLWLRRESFDWGQPVVPWLLVATRRLATDRFRRLRRLGRILGPARVTDLSSAMSADSSEDGVIAWMDVRAAFGRLTDRERTALIATTVLGLTAEAAAEPLGMTPGGVRAAASRARQKLEGMQ
jgi:RNA polymerase sigma-70 factor (ECF subfamily)